MSPPPKYVSYRPTAHFGVQTSLPERLFLLLTYTNRQNHTILLYNGTGLPRLVTSPHLSVHRPTSPPPPPPPSLNLNATRRRRHPTTITQSQCDALIEQRGGGDDRINLTAVAGGVDRCRLTALLSLLLSPHPPPSCVNDADGGDS